MLGYPYYRDQRVSMMDNIEARRKREREAAATERKLHRNKPRATRLVADMDKVAGDIRELAKETSTPLKLQKYGPARAARQNRILLQRWSKLMDMYNKAIAV